MKSFTFIALFSLLILVLNMSFSPKGEAYSKEGIQFQSSSWNDVLELAKKEHKLVFVDIYTSWCGPCKMLKSRTFPNSEVGAFYNGNFINYAVDAEMGEGINLAKKYNVTAYPTLLFVNGKGELVYRTMGYRSPKQFLKIGEKVLKMN